MRSIRFSLPLSYKPLGQAYVRVPLLPIETIREDQDDMDMDSIAKSPAIHEALLIASTALVEAMAHHQNISAKKQEQLRGSILRYIIRMSSRTTPFGIFAGVAQVAIDNSTNIYLSPIAGHRHRTRPDMEWLQSFIETLEKDPAIRQDLVYTYQHNAVRIGNRYHFEHWDDGKLTATTVVATTGFEKMIEKTRTGKRYKNLMRELLAEIPEAEPEEMAQFIDKYITYGVICSSLKPPLTCADPARYVLGQLKKIPKACAAAQLISNLLDHTAHYDTLSVGVGSATFQRLVDEAVRINSIPTTHSPLAVDLSLSFAKRPTIQYSIAEDACRMAELLFRLSPQDLNTSRLSSYRERFVEHYGTRRLIPVLEVIDDTYGIGQPDGHFSQPHPPAQADRDELLFKLSLQALRAKEPIIQLNDKLLTKLTNSQYDEKYLPQSLDIAVQVAATSQDAVNQREYLLVRSPLTGAPAAGRIAGRFADMLGDRAVSYLRQIATAYAGSQEEYIHAELVYMPCRIHAANAAIRPAIHDYEITVGVTPGVKTGYTLLLDELFVGVDAGQFYVWSAAHKKKVQVHVGNMVNLAYAPTACRLIADIALDSKLLLLPFSWGAARQLPILPRVQYQNIVLSLATWTLSPSDLDAIQPPDASAAPTPWPEGFSRWRKEWRVPRFVYLADGDNRLLLDLDKAAHIVELERVARASKGNQKLHLQEALPGPNNAWAISPDGHRMSEFILQLTRTPRISTTPAKPLHQMASLRVQEANNAQRIHFLGSEWLFCKLYIPLRQQDEYLSIYISRFIRAVAERHATDIWFFVRYRDPEPHIRLRFKSEETHIMKTLLPLLSLWARQMQVAGLLQRFVIDSYEQETERYGGAHSIGLAESIFTADSVLALRLLGLSTADLRGLLLSDIVALTSSIMMECFGLSDTAQQEWATHHADYRKFAQDYRGRRKPLLSLFHAYRTSSDSYSEIRTICDEFKAGLALSCSDYRTLSRTQKLTAPLEEIIGSFVHMHCNRMLGIDHQAEEGMIAHLARVLNDLPKWQENGSHIRNIP